MQRLLFLVLTSYLMVGCATTRVTYTTPQLEPIAIGSGGSEPIAFRRVIIRIPAGTRIGAHHDGLLKIPQFPYYWQSNLGVGSEEFNLTANEELKTYGYNVLGRDNLLFGEDRSSKARYQLGGTITNIVYNTYAPLAGNFTEVHLAIEWQLFDTLNGEVVFKLNATGYANQPGVSSAVVFKAFRSALFNLMASRDFVALVAKDAKGNRDVTTTWENAISIKKCGETPAIFLPDGIEKVLDGVVTIRVGATTASGVIVSADGHILTAAHVVSGVNEVTVNMRSGLTLTAEVLRADKAQDIALIRIPGLGHRCLSLALSNIPAIGTEVFAIGTPLSEKLALSVTKGIVSGHRLLSGFQYIQTDASLNPGNSGGPLINKKGQVVGIVSWKIAAPGFEGLSFGVPPQVIEHRLGISWK